MERKGRAPFGGCDRLWLPLAPRGAVVISTPAEPEPELELEPEPEPIDKLCTKLLGIASISAKVGTGFIYEHVSTAKLHENGIRLVLHRKPLVLLVWLVGGRTDGP